MSDDIIDLSEYLRRSDDEDSPPSTFALWGAEGERSRFALPLWRTIYLASGERGGVLYLDPAEDELRAFVVLDLAQDPPRTTFTKAHLAGLTGSEPPELVEDAPRALTIYLGARGSRRWFLVVERGHASRPKILAPRDREDILFLAGECAGLLFLRDFAEDPRTED